MLWERLYKPISCRRLIIAPKRFASWLHDLQGNNDLLSLTQPEIIQNIHNQYFEAGADVIETNTFNANAISMADYKMEELVTELNIESARLATEAREKWIAKDGKPRWVAGAMGPLNKTLSISPDVNDPGYRAVEWEEVVAAYYQQAKALLEGGVDLLLLEDCIRHA